MERRTCNNCGKEYAVVRDDALLAYNELSPWLGVCRHCTCCLRRYHKWTVTDRGVRICAACFIPSLSLKQVVNLVAQRK